jgi:hypothetical protein
MKFVIVAFFPVEFEFFRFVIFWLQTLMHIEDRNNHLMEDTSEVNIIFPNNFHKSCLYAPRALPIIRLLWRYRCPSFTGLSKIFSVFFWWLYQTLTIAFCLLLSAVFQ